MYKYIAAALFTISIFSCQSKQDSTSKPDVVAANIDTTIDPSADFFAFANGGWIKRNPIPGEQSSWGIGNLVIEENLKRLREISEKAATANDKKGSNNQIIGNFWKTAMDSVKIEKDGLAPLEPLLKQINSINDYVSLLNTVAEFKKMGSNTMFNDYVGQDAKNSEVMAYQLNQGGLGLPEREYYFKNDSTTINIRNQYLAYISGILTMAGEDADVSTQAAKNILSLETKLASASRKIEDLQRSL
jgi:putative endopeptidase